MKAQERRGQDARDTSHGAQTTSDEGRVASDASRAAGHESQVTGPARQDAPALSDMDNLWIVNWQEYTK